jgi:hypothetical protein
MPLSQVPIVCQLPLYSSTSWWGPWLCQLSMYGDELMTKANTKIQFDFKMEYFTIETGNVQLSLIW